MNQYYISYYNWLGVSPDISNNRHIEPIKANELNPVRDLFDRLALLSISDRRQVIQWGLYVKDDIMVRLVCWGGKHLNNIQPTQANGEEIPVNELRSLLFLPRELSLALTPGNLPSTKWQS